MDDNGNGLQIECVPTGKNGSATLTARLGGEVLAVESLNLAKPKARAGFAESVCKDRPGIKREKVDAELLKLASDLAGKPDEQAAGFCDAPEVDTSRIIRPERVIMPEASGLAVPSMTAMGDKVRGRWLLYLRWADGKREKRPLGPTVETPDGGRLWIHPEASEPTPNTRPGWSAASRERWLKGEPAPDAADLFARLAERFACFLDLPKSTGPAVTATLVCWTVLSYVYHAWPAVPYLFIGGPLGSGKSRVFEILSRLVFRPLASSNMSAASLFRTLHANGGTLILDEAERLKQSREPDVAEILSMLLAGYKRGGCAMRLEPVGDSGFKTVTFDVYSPKALACIAGLPPALASRSIPITMFRAAPGSPKPKRRIDADPDGWRRLRDDLHILALEHGPTWLAISDRPDVVPSGLGGRDYELWQPLLAIGAFVEEAGAQGLLGLLQEHAEAVANSGKDDATPDADETLLQLLAESIRFGERPTPNDLLTKAREAEPVVFKNWYPRTVTARLKTYGIPTPRKSGSRREFRDVTAEHFQRIQDSYGIDLDYPEDDTQTTPGEPSQ